MCIGDRGPFINREQGKFSGMNGHFSPIDPLFPVEPLTPEILPCSLLMNGPLSPMEPYFLFEF
jgi:hypothetical protein